MIKEEYMVSIIVPIFNVEKYVSECIESIMSQTYENIQIILVDDGSTDLSAQICDKYGSQDQRIEVVHQYNKGVVSARKAGLERAKGDYIGFVDGDDYIVTDMYERLMEEMLRSDADFVHSGYFRNNESIIPFTRRDLEILEDGTREELIRTEMLGTQSYIAPSIWSKLFKAEFIKKNFNLVPDNARYGEDWICLFLCLGSCRKISLLDEAYYHYRNREDSTTNEKGFSSLENVLNYYENVCNVLEDYKCSEELKSLIKEYVCSCILRTIKKVFCNDFQVATYYYPHIDEIQGKKIVIYGAGIVGRDYYAQISRFRDCCIVAWTDTQYEKYDYPYIKLCNVNELSRMEFDILIIAVAKEKLANEIRSELVCRGIEENKICWTEPKPYELRRKI